MSTHFLLPPQDPPVGRLALLTLAVLGLHLGLLTGFPAWTDGDDPGDFSLPAGPATRQAESAVAAEQGPPADAPRPVERSSVRWLLVPPPPPPPPAPPPAPVRRPPPAQPQVEQRTPAPAPSPAAEASPAPETQGGEQALPLQPAAQPEPEPVSAPADATAASGVQQPTLIEAPVTKPVPPGIPPPAATPDSSRASSPAGSRDGALPAFRTLGLPAARPPASMSLTYDVNGQSKGMQYQASGTLDWQHDGQAYQAQMRVSAFMLGSRTQRSAGQLHATGLHPDRFIDISRRERETRFDGEQARIGYTGIAHQDPLQAGAQDRLSIILQLASRFNVMPPTAGQRMSFQVVGVSSAEPWAFEVLGQERVSVAAGDFTAWHVRRMVPRPGDAQLSIWLAPELDHLPVRLVLTQPNGDQLEQALRRLP